MAARKGKKTVQSMHTRILSWVREYEGVSFQEVSEEFGITDVEANNVLVELSNDDLVEIKDGMWIALPTEDWQQETEQDEARARLEYAVRAAETQDEVMSQSPKVQARDKDLKAAEPIQAADGTTVTVPVDFDDLSKGRRELDASKGERLLSEDTYTVRTVIPQPDKGLAQFKDEETGDMVFESSIIKNGLALDEPSEIPPLPAGVNRNVWELAHSAITQTARDYWRRQATAAMEEFAMNAGQPAPF
jgi:hypothetical protein